MTRNELQEKYGGKHIARRGDKVIAYSDNLAELLEKLKDEGLLSEETVVEYVRPKGAVYAL